MTAQHKYRYDFEPYTGKQSRFECPQCHQANEYTRYIDLQTGAYLPYIYGICNRKNKCAYHKSPFEDGYFKNQIEKEKQQEVPKFIPRPTAPKKQIFIPQEIKEQSLSNYEQNSFVLYLNQLLGADRTEKLIKQFQIGTSNYWRGSAVFWLQDTQNKVYGGQIILFDKEGHTLKETRPDGSKKRYNGWVHIALKKHYRQYKNAIPKWLEDYSNFSPKFPIPFGLHQLQDAPANKKIALVESAKTAIIASAYLPQFIWMAIGGLSYLNASRLLPLQNRKLILFPDKGGYETWQNKTASLSHIAPIVVTDFLETQNIPDGSDLADFLVAYDVEEMSI